MYKVKYYLWLVAVAVCFDISVHAVPANGEISNPCNPPSNDIPQPDAIDLTGETTCYDGSNICATEEATNTNSCGYNKASVWYTFQVATQRYYEIKTSNTTFNSVLTLFEDDGSNLTEIACVNDDKFSFGEHLYEKLSANTDYYIMVSGADDGICITEGVFCIEINTIAGVPANQECERAGAINLSNGTACVTGNNRYASRANPQPSCSPYVGASVWYKITGVDKMQISSTFNYSEVITVYEGICGDLTERICKLNGTGDTDDLIVNNLSASETYYIQVTGNFVTIEADNENCSQNHITISTNFSCPTDGDDCDDYNPDTISDKWDGNCNCVGECFYENDICDDGNSQTINDSFNENCECIGTISGSGDCEENITLYGPSESGLFEASNSIVTDINGTVSVNGSLKLKAGDHILLRPGFTASEGTDFHGYIDDCESDSGQKTDESALTTFVKHYPNPFRDEFTLEFNLTTDAEVHILVSDVNGRTVTQLPTKQLYQGIQTINIPTENWIAGIYFYQALIKEQSTGTLKRANGTLVKM